MVKESTSAMRRHLPKKRDTGTMDKDGIRIAAGAVGLMEVGMLSIMAVGAAGTLGTIGAVGLMEDGIVGGGDALMNRHPPIPHRAVKKINLLPRTHRHTKMPRARTTRLYTLEHQKFLSLPRPHPSPDTDRNDPQKVLASQIKKLHFYTTTLLKDDVDDEPWR